MVVYRKGVIILTLILILCSHFIYAEVFGYNYLNEMDTTAGVTIINYNLSMDQFTELTDVPNSYVGGGGDCVQVKADETGLEFVPCAGGGDFSFSDFSSSFLSNFTGKYDNESWNEARANTLYATIGSSGGDFFLANFTDSFNANLTYYGLVNNASYLSTYNATYDATTTAWNGNFTAYSKFWYNHTQNSDNRWIIRNGSMDFNFNETKFNQSVAYLVSLNNTPALNDILNPTADKTFAMTTKSVSFTFTSPSGQPTYDGAFEIQADGAFTGDLLHVHQHTGNPGATDLVHLESTDVDVLPLHVMGTGIYVANFSGGNMLLNNVIVYPGNHTKITFDIYNSTWDNRGLIASINSSISGFIKNDTIANLTRLGIGINVAPDYLLTLGLSATTLNASGFLYANSTNVGIGTATPYRELHVKTNSNGGGITVQRNSASANTYADIAFLMTSTDSATASPYIRAYRRATGQDLMIGNNGGAQWWFLYSGNMGIGTATPAYLLEIANNETALNVSGNLYVNSSNVGIGRSNPLSTLHIDRVTTSDTEYTGVINNYRWNSATVDRTTGVTGILNNISINNANVDEIRADIYGIKNFLEIEDDQSLFPSKVYGSFNNITFDVVGASASDSTPYAGYFETRMADASGTTAYGIYATASGAQTNWAGYFNGNVTISDCLFFGSGGKICSGT